MIPESTENASATTVSGRTRWLAAFWIAWSAVTGVALWQEMPRWLTNAQQDRQGGISWISDPNVDWTPFLPVLFLAVPFWFVRRPVTTLSPKLWRLLTRWQGESCPTPEQPTPYAEHVRAVLLSLLVAGAGFAMSRYVGGQFGELPPAYHDEFSYLFQAQTFLAGRLSFPSHPGMPELFDQMHVLNEGRFASRYFPGAGLWTAPFLAMGNPWWGHWTAHALASFLLFWIGRHLANNRVGLLAGLLLAVSPGVGLFSNLLLAHHPTLVGLMIFVITFLKLRVALRAGRPVWGWAIIAGTGLTYAMLCRPMTAAGVGLPFGVWFGWWLMTGRGSDSHRDWPVGMRLRTAGALCLPLIAGFGGLLFFNQSITGNPLVTPYQQYTDIYTPRHVYGFNNRVRGEARLGPKVLEHYDVWAENLTPALATRNVWRRFVFSFRWTLGIVPLAIVAVTFALTADRWSGDWWMMAAAILSLHAAHIPYWFEGIMGWHYVFESAPFWLLIFAGVSDRLLRVWSAAEHPGMALWSAMIVGTALLVNLVTIPPLWPSRIDVGIAEAGFSRQRYAAFQEHLSSLAGDRPALVLVDPDPTDRHIDYVTNEPGLDGHVLVGRYRAGATDLAEVKSAFPERELWLVRAATGETVKLSDP